MTAYYDVIVIGGGASGMMAAISAAENGARVLLVEKNKRLGEKLRITGGGRCNITNAEDNLRVLLKNYGTAEKYLYSAFTAYGVSDTIAFFENNKLPIKVEARGRAFPASDKAADVVHTLINRLHRLDVSLAAGTQVTDIVAENGTIQRIICNDVTYSAPYYILATGGTSHPETGSTGDGFAWLKKIGHTTKDPTPTITPLAVREKWVAKAAGNTVNDIAIYFYSNAAKAFKLNGPVLFTHFGVSGPLILNNAYKVADLLQLGEVNARIDYYPKIDIKTLDQKIISVLNDNGTKLLKNTLPLLVPAGTATMLAEYLQDTVDLQTKNSEVSKQMRSHIITTLKEMPLTIEKLMGFEKAVVADGGVALQEIDMRTMRSLKIHNMYVTGDLLDIKRPSGGYSLQLCWTTGYIAGKHAASSLLQ